jgi:glycosyltransferase involved in cell wall biosynthesis
MRVLMTADAVGGVWQYALQLSAQLGQRGAQVLIATMGPPPSDAQRDDAARVAGLTLCTSTYALEWMTDPWTDVEEAGRWLLQRERDFKPDVVHINGYVHASLPWRAPTLVVAHSCVCSWWEAVHGTMPPPEWNEYVSRVTAGLIAATGVAAPTRAMADAIGRLYHVDRHVAVVPNGRDPHGFGTAPKESFVLSAGRVWDAAKNVAALDTAAADLPWPVYVAGDAQGPLGNGESLVHLRALGRLEGPALAGYMARAAIYALPARYEPFGLSVLEAALSECALVLGDIPSLRENWSGVAHFVHPQRRDELGEALRFLIENPDRRAALARKARQRAERFSVEKHVADYHRLYREMVTSHGRSTH